MFGKDFDASNSLNAEAMEILRGLLQQLRTKPASPEDWTKAASPRHWNLQQIAQAKRDVVAQYGGEFSAANLEQLDRDTILGFLKFQNNRHWYQRFPEEPKHLQDKDLRVHYFVKKSLSWYAPNIRP